MQGWATTIRTGDPAADLRAIEQHRAHAQQQGLVLHVQPLPTGGYQVQAAPPAAANVPSAQRLGAEPDPAAAYGGTMPSPNRPPTPAPMAAVPSAMPGPVPAAWPTPGPAPGAAPPPYDPGAVYGGTLPSPAGFAAVQRPAPEIVMHPSAQYAGMGTCQACGREGPTKSVTFMQNVGVIVIRFPRTISGHLCKFCVDKFFFKMTLVTLFLGWWGVISFFYTLVALPMNVVNRLRTIGMPSPREDAGSVAEKRSRGLALLLAGAVLAVLSALHLVLLAAALAGGAGAADVAVTIAIGVVFLDVPAALCLFSGLRDRVRASRAARALGVA